MAAAAAGEVVAVIGDDSLGILDTAALSLKIKQSKMEAVFWALENFTLEISVLKLNAKFT